MWLEQNTGARLLGSTFTGCKLRFSPTAEAAQEGDAVFCAWQLTTYLKSTIPQPHAAPVDAQYESALGGPLPEQRATHCVSVCLGIWIELKSLTCRAKPAMSRLW